MGVVVTIAGGVALLSQPARVWVANAPATIQSIQQNFRGSTLSTCVAWSSRFA